MIIQFALTILAWGDWSTFFAHPARVWLVIGSFLLLFIAWFSGSSGLSGGEAHFPADSEGMAAACRGIAREIRTRYTVGYLPPETNGGSLRNIRVSVAAPGRSRLTARTRERYRYETGDQR